MRWTTWKHNCSGHSYQCCWPALQRVYHPVNGHVTCAATWYADYWTQHGFSHSVREPFNRLSFYSWSAVIAALATFSQQLQYMKSKPCPHIILSLRYDVFVSCRAFNLFPHSTPLCVSHKYGSLAAEAAQRKMPRGRQILYMHTSGTFHPCERGCFCVCASPQQSSSL